MFEKEELIDLPEDVFRLLRDLIRDYCGIFFNDDSRYLLEKRLSRRVKNHHLSSFRDYYRFLLYDKSRDEELASIMDILTVNETYFFREQGQLKTFSEEILPELKEINRDKKRLRIWSAGCSTGEEPYTIAMFVIEKGYFYGWDIEIFGSDINQRVLQVARNGVYRKNSFRTTDEYFLKKYFKEENSLFRISNTVKQFVNFSHLNLLDPFKVKFIGSMDIIFCRNVLIYFDPQSKKKVVETFYERLVEGGYLLLGHAESLINVTTAFTLRHFKYDMVYQKPVKQGVYTNV
ncbi:MAG: protein-glutamate O-methyltransferase CheR [Nitrospirota bacterium]|nr:protein-glutamate O-methyltransferase CheR [Nitrospirota bacterium]MDH5768898.1 protein-glutamate O-methyltransferase CheR [Nitrospirota bacterium]